MVFCNFCLKNASLIFKDNDKKKYSCSSCVKKYNIQHTYSRLHCCECLDFGGWILNKKRYCYIHKPIKAVVTSPKCIECKTFNATFGIKGNTPQYCENCHDADIHINLRVKKCVKCCINNAYFKEENETTPKYCGECKTEGMKSVKSKYCTTLNCKKQASYGYIGETVIKCAEHKEIDMCSFRKYRGLINTKYTTLKNKRKREN